MVHRLDGPVAGLVVVARTSKAASRLSDQFRLGRVEKQYLAVGEGRPPRQSDCLENFVVRAGRYSRIGTYGSPAAQKALLHYQVRDNGENNSLLALTLETGRRHQIRLQLSHIGCPIVGDVNYGAAAALAHGRIALLAHRLSFDHPTQSVRLQFETPMPRGWPWPAEPHGAAEAEGRPLWTIEEYEQEGLMLPAASEYILNRA
jgi:23S rRNA pseudouridine1911/1915/1917 synthase